jgi:hypothetical protein
MNNIKYDSSFGFYLFLIKDFFLTRANVKIYSADSYQKPWEVQEIH